MTVGAGTSVVFVHGAPLASGGIVTVIVTTGADSITVVVLASRVVVKRDEGISLLPGATDGLMAKVVVMVDRPGWS